jgi:hypothetical protein
MLCKAKCLEHLNTLMTWLISISPRSLEEFTRNRSQLVPSSSQMNNTFMGNPMLATSPTIGNQHSNMGASAAPQNFIPDRKAC